MQPLSVTKCQGTGNDFVLVDARVHALGALAPLARFLCDRHFGVGADGLLVITDADDPRADLGMQIFNADGSQAEMCGNGIRCLARCVYTESPRKRRLTVQTRAGLAETAIIEKSGRPAVRVVLGVPAFLAFPSGQHEQRLAIGNEAAVAYIVSIGNPHVPIFVQQDLARLNLEAVARQVASWDLFPIAPNVEVAHIEPTGLGMRVYERGVGETLGCGTGASAVAAAAIHTQRAHSPVSVSSRGGSVQIEWPSTGECVQLTGDAEIVFQTQINVPDEFAAAAAV